MAQLIDDVINMLDFDSEHIKTDDSAKSKINIIIENGKQHLRSFHPALTGEDFIRSTRARSLLFDYCRYAYSNATEQFDNNFAADILMLRQEYEVKAYDSK